MISSVFKNILGSTPKKQAKDQPPEVDISRVIPGYKSPERAEDAPEGEPQAAELIADDASNMDSISTAVTPDDNASPEERAEAAVASMADKHDTWAQTDLTRLQDAWSKVRGMDDLSNDLQEVKRATHNLKGMATTYGHPSISRLASSLCKLLSSEQAGQQHALVNLHIEACRAAYFEGTSTEDGDMVAQSVCVALETQVSRTLQA